MNEDAVQDRITELERQQTYIAFFGRSIGFFWFQADVRVREAIADLLDGSAGLDDKTVEWAAEFDKMWEEREAIIHVEDFQEQIHAFADAKIKTLIAEARLS